MCCHPYGRMVIHSPDRSGVHILDRSVLLVGNFLYERHKILQSHACGRWGKIALVWFIGLWHFACPVYSSTSSPWMFIYYTIRVITLSFTSRCDIHNWTFWLWLITWREVIFPRVHNVVMYFWALTLPLEYHLSLFYVVQCLRVSSDAHFSVADGLQLQFFGASSALK